MTVQIAQTYQFTDGTGIDPRRLQAELSNIAATLNNANAGLLTWDNVKATTLTLTNAPVFSALTASRVTVTDSGKALASSSVTSATLAFLDATSSVQTQLNTKASTDLSNVASVSANVPLNSHKLTGLAAGTTNGDSVRFEQLPTITNGTFTPSVAGFGTLVSPAGYYQQIGNMVHVWGSFESGTAAASTASMAVPVGSIVYTNRLNTNGSVQIGWFQLMFGARAIASGNLSIVFADGSDTTNVYFTATAPATGSAAWPKSNGTSFSSSCYFCFDFWYATA